MGVLISGEVLRTAMPALSEKRLQERTCGLNEEVQEGRTFNQAFKEEHQHLLSRMKSGYEEMGSINLSLAEEGLWI